MALDPCIENGDCIDLSLQPNGNLRADLVVDDSDCGGLVCGPDGLALVLDPLGCGLVCDENGLAVTLDPSACQGITCGPNGLFVPRIHSQVAAGTTPQGTFPPYSCLPVTQGWCLDLTTAGIPLNVPTVVANWTDIAGVPIGAGSIVNPSTCLEMNIIGGYTGREVDFSAPAGLPAGGPKFIVEIQSASDLALTWGSASNIMFDYRDRVTLSTVQERKAQCSGTGAAVVPVSSTFYFAYRIVLTIEFLPPPGPPLLLKSPGLTFAFSGVSDL